MSFWFTKFNGFLDEESPKRLSPPAEIFPPSKGTPSITISGPFPERTEELPLILIDTPAPGSPLDCVTCTPATFPLSN